MARDNPIWSIEVALRYGYVMEPHVPTSRFYGPKAGMGDSCAVRTNSIYANWNENKKCKLSDGEWQARLAPACKPQCAECSHICYMNDYIRGYLPPHYPVPVTHVAYIGKYGVYLSHVDMSRDYDVFVTLAHINE